MLIRCEIGNFKSFKEPQEINLFPYGQNSFKENIYYFNDNELYFGTSKKENEKRNKNRLLKLALITGKNASGKSNFFEGMEFFKDFFIKDRDNLFSFDEFSLEENKLDTIFEIEFIHNQKYIQYSLKINKFERKINEERLSVKILNKKTFEEVFYVKDGEILIFNTNHIKSKGIKEFFMNNTSRSLIKILKDANDSFIKENFLSFFENVVIIHKNNPITENNFILNKIKLKEMLLERKNGKSCRLLELIEKFVSNLDTGIKRLDIEDGMDENYGNLSSEAIEKVKKYRIKTIHNKYDLDGKIIGETKLDLYTNESTGTRKIVELSFAIISSLCNGTPVLIDELTTYFHNKITEEVIDLYRMDWTRGQLIFSTHNDNLLDYDFRKDQIYIIDKNEKEESEIFSLIDTDFRNDLSTAKQYMAGKFGSFPKVNLNFLRDGWED